MNVATVVDVTASTVTIENTRYLVRGDADDVIGLAARIPRALTTSSVRFLLGVREAGGRDFKLVQFSGTATSLIGTTRDVTINYFEAVKLEPALERITFWNEKAPSDGLTVPLRGLRGIGYEVSAFVFPVSTWGNLESDYDYELTVTSE